MPITHWMYASCRHSKQYHEITRRIHRKQCGGVLFYHACRSRHTTGRDREYLLALRACAVNGPYGRGGATEVHAQDKTAYHTKRYRASSVSVRSKTLGCCITGDRRQPPQRWHRQSCVAPHVKIPSPREAKYSDRDIIGPSKRLIRRTPSSL